MPSRTRPKPKPPNDPAEYERFVEAARKLGLDESPDALDRAFERVISPCAPKEGPRRSKSTS
jgi:hypothetical protein